jgi:membrane protease YdiL (CAAX protease family)
MIRQTVSRWRRAAAAIPAAMLSVFRYTVRRFGERRGYQAGFVVYWVLCCGLAAAIGPYRWLIQMWRAPGGPLPTPGALLWSVLLIPPAGAVATELIPKARKAGPPAALTAAGLGVTNALAEEVLWRGLPLAVFPDERVRGWLWPSVCFTAWHLIPLSCAPIRADAGRCCWARA